MKLASLKHGRDGRLVVVSRDLARFLPADVPTMQAALDDWDTHELGLRRLAERVEGEGEPFDQSACASPLPRAYQWLDGSAYLNHVELVRRARGAAMPESFRTDPLMYQGASDRFLGPRDPIRFPSEAADWGVDFEGEVAVVAGDVPMGANEKVARAAIRLVMLCNDVSLRHLIPNEVSKGFGFLQGKPPSAFSPVAVTPDALEGWDGGTLHGELNVHLNGEPFGRADAGAGMAFDFPRLVAHAARTRALGAGTIVGSGTVSNKPDGRPARPIGEGGPGYSCIAEVRMLETIEGGAAKTPFMRDGDYVRIEMGDVFGAIDQRVEFG